MLKQRHQLFVCLFALADALVVIIACLTAWGVRRWVMGQGLPGAEGLSGVRTWLLEPLVIFAVPVTLISMRMCGLYLAWRDRRLLSELRSIANATMLAVVAMIVVVWALGPGVAGGFDPLHRVPVVRMMVDAGRLQLGLLAVTLPCFLMLERIGVRWILRGVRRSGRNLRHVAVIGTGRLGRICCRTLERNTWTGLHVAYFVDHNDPAVHTNQSTVLHKPVRGGVRDLEAILDEHPVDAVYLALPNARAAMIPQLLRRLERFPLEVRIIPDVSPRYTPLSMTINELEGMPVLSVRENPMLGVGGVVKRAIDMLGSLAGIVLMALPMLAIAGIIKATTPGPVIFRQRRVSLGGEEFDILKFRTMRLVADEQADEQSKPEPARWTTRNDPRITPVGRWLRRTSLDELPQLFNVLAGEMSLVGPRPERPELIGKFREDWRGYMLRQHVKAGITGWAQVNGHRGDTGLRKRIQHDIFYIRHWSLGFDLKILVLTLFRGFVHRNAH